MDSPDEREPPDVITSDTDNATTIQPREAPAHKRRKFRKFRAYNTGTWNGPKRENKEVVYRQDNLHRFDSISSSLGLNKHQKSRGRSLLDDLDFQHLGIDIDLILFGVCAIVANSDVEDGSRYYPHPEAKGDSCFEEVAESLGIGQHDQISAIEKVRSRVNL